MRPSASPGVEAPCGHLPLSAQRGWRPGSLCAPDCSPSSAHLGAVPRSLHLSLSLSAHLSLTSGIRPLLLSPQSLCSPACTPGGASPTCALGDCTPVRAHLGCTAAPRPLEPLESLQGPRSTCGERVGEHHPRSPSGKQSWAGTASLAEALQCGGRV